VGVTEGHGEIDSASDPNQEYIYFKGLETLPSTCYFPTNLIHSFTLRVLGTIKLIKIMVVH